MAVDFFLNLSNDIKGESVDANHKDQIAVMSFSWGASQTTSVAGTGGSGAGKANLAEFNIMKTYDKASVPLFKSLLKGVHIDTGVLTASKAGGDGKPFIQLSFTELFVTSVQMSGSSEVPMENVSFSYNSLKTEYFMQNDKGILTASGVVSYDLKKNAVS